jgi:hypothetical protein
VIEDFLDSPQGVNGKDNIHLKNTLSQIFLCIVPNVGNLDINKIFKELADL